jgi:geranylgeranyl pyrophosphate synthase
MSRAAYFNYLAETASVVGPYIEKLLQPYREQHEGLYNELMLFAGPRLHRPLQKPALFRLAYEVCGGKDWERYVPVAAAFELLNISSYQANASFDHKLGTLTDEKKDAQFIAAMISRELAAKAIRECSAVSPESLAGLEKSISHINEHIYLAQYYDLFVLTVQQLDRYVNDERLFLSDYHKRCYFGSGIFNGQICKWGGRLALGNDEQLAALKAFGEGFGTALQIANDIGDYAPLDAHEPNSRDYQDRYSDFRNGRLTAILYHLLSQCPEPSEKLATHRAELSDSIRKLSNTCVSCGSFSYARGLVAQFAQKADNALSLFGPAPYADLLKQLASVVTSNKFNTAFRKASCESHD